MQTFPTQNPVNSQVTFSKDVNVAITVKAKELGVTRSRLINTIVAERLLATPKTKTVLRKKAIK